MDCPYPWSSEYGRSPVSHTVPAASLLATFQLNSSLLQHVPRPCVQKHLARRISHRAIIFHMLYLHCLQVPLHSLVDVLLLQISTIEPQLGVLGVESEPAQQGGDVDNASRIREVGQQLFGESERSEGVGVHDNLSVGKVWNICFSIFGACESSIVDQDIDFPAFLLNFLGDFRDQLIDAVWAHHLQFFASHRVRRIELIPTFLSNGGGFSGSGIDEGAWVSFEKDGDKVEPDSLVGACDQNCQRLIHSQNILQKFSYICSPRLKQQPKWYWVLLCTGQDELF